MVFELPVTLLIQHLEDALAKGNQEDAREAFTSLLTVGKLWLEEIQKSPTSLLVEQGRLFTRGMDSYDRMLRRNAEIAEYAPFLIGQHAEAEQIGYGPRTIWVPVIVRDFRPAAMRARLHRNPRALDYYVQEEDGAESWRADESLRKKIER
ncbi:MAG: hypothetical protein U1A78_15270 [Polyangia bacterium]